MLDDLTLGPAAGGIRTCRYASWTEALRDATRLAHAMTVKCALAGLDAGGGKAVVLEHDGLDRARAFAVLGRRIEELGEGCGAIGTAVTRALADAAAADTLAARGVLFVPDPIASAGAVIDGIARSVMGHRNPSPLIARLGETAREVLVRAHESGRAASRIAEELASARLDAERR